MEIMDLQHGGSMLRMEFINQKDFSMIDPKELRIGNIVMTSEQDIIMGIGLDLIESMHHAELLPEMIEPIEITTEWLVRLGFVEGFEKNIFYEDNFFIHIEKLNDEFNIVNRDSMEIITEKPFKYIHQLQNLYFSLTGKELELNPD